MGLREKVGTSDPCPGDGQGEGGGDAEEVAGPQTPPEACRDDVIGNYNPGWPGWYRGFRNNVFSIIKNIPAQYFETFI